MSIVWRNSDHFVIFGVHKSGRLNIFELNSITLFLISLYMSKTSQFTRTPQTNRNILLCSIQTMSTLALNWASVCVFCDAMPINWCSTRDRSLRHCLSGLTDHYTLNTHYELIDRHLFSTRRFTTTRPIKDTFWKGTRDKVS